MRYVSIYAILDPGTGRARYVGQTRHALGRRLEQHLYDARRGGQSPRAAWLRSLAEAPEIKLLERVPHGERCAAETRHIQREARRGGLLN